MDLGVLHNTNIVDGVYTCGLDGYSIVSTNASSQHHGGVAVFYRVSPHFKIEVIHQFGPNIVRFQLTTVDRR